LEQQADGGQRAARFDRGSPPNSTLTAALAVAPLDQIVLMIPDDQLDALGTLFAAKPASQGDDVRRIPRRQRLRLPDSVTRRLSQVALARAGLTGPRTPVGNG